VRLIDADALPIVARGKNHHRKYVFADITDAPTIDAIPVEWLREFDLYYAGISDGTKYMNELVEAWQKGQEAQDG